VTKIYPSKVTLQNGQHVYQIDVQSNQVKTVGKYDQGGSVIIKSNVKDNITLVPVWTVLNNENIWVIEKNKPVLKKVTIGKTHGELIEVLDGLSPENKIIVNPKYIISGKYQIL